jgi:hypothetical protein
MRCRKAEQQEKRDERIPVLNVNRKILESAMDEQESAEQGLMKSVETGAHGDEISPEILAVITAAAMTFLSKTGQIRFARLVRVEPTSRKWLRFGRKKPAAFTRSARASSEVRLRKREGI